MDNQQVTVSQFDLGWLSGVIDGEGCFTMSPGSNGGWNVSFKFVNTNDEINTKVCGILRRLGVSYHVYASHRAANQRPAERIEINGPKRLKRFFDVFYQYLVAKQFQAKLLMDYINIRLSTPYGEMDPTYAPFVYRAMRGEKK